MWAESAIEKLDKGEEAIIYPRGHSMKPLVLSGQKVVLEPISETDVLEKDDIVLVRVKGRVYLHKINAIQGDRVQIANNRGHINGWVYRSKVYGRML